MSFRAHARGRVESSLGFWHPAWCALALGLSVVGCQSDDHPAYAAGCTTDCKPTTGIGLGSPIAGGAGSTSTVTDAGTGTLTGNVVLLNDITFSAATAYTLTAVVSADGVTAGSAVTAPWDGTDPYTLEGVAQEAANWVSVKPDDAQGDALLTYQPVATDNVSSASLAVISSATLDTLFTSVSSQRSPDFGQVVLFFRSVGTGAPVAGLHVAMAAAQIAAYASASGFVLDDGTAVTNASGLVVFGNVDAPTAGTQAVTVTRPATATAPATSGGSFAIKVAPGDATIATVNVQL